MPTDRRDATSMEFEQIRAEVDDRVLTITLNRPDRLNAWTGTMGRELIAAFDRADADDEVRVVVVTGAGRGYCAGADLASGGDTFDWRARESSDPVPRDGGGQFTLRVFESVKPVIAAINGPAVGIGATMTLPMDIRLAADDARIGFVFTRRGIVPEACSSWFLPRLVGISRAMEWVATGRVFSAQEGLEAGLVRREAIRRVPAVIGATKTGPTAAARYAAACSGWARDASGKKVACCRAKTRHPRKPLSPATTLGNAPWALSKQRTPRAAS